MIDLAVKEFFSIVLSIPKVTIDKQINLTDPVDLQKFRLAYEDLLNSTNIWYRSVDLLPIFRQNYNSLNLPESQIKKLGELIDDLAKFYFVN